MVCCCRVEVCFVQFDLVYQDVLVSVMINCIMCDGKKNFVSCIFYGVCCLVQECIGQELLKVFKQVYDNVKFCVEVCSCCVGGLIYQVFVEVGFCCQQSLILCWMISVVDGCFECIVIECFVGEIMDVVQGCGGVIKKKDDVECMVEVNCVYVYYCW